MLILKNIFMKRLSVIFVFTSLILCLFSCKNEYKNVDGAMMKFYSENKNNEMPEIGDLVLVDVTQKIADSVIFSSEIFGEPFEMVVEEPTFIGDIMTALTNMHLDDHVSLIFPVDSLFRIIGEDMPDFIVPGTLTEMDIKLNKIIKAEDYEKAILEEKEMMRSQEEALLSLYYNDDKYTITEDSLIIVKMNRGKGRLAAPSDIMRVYFTFQTINGDTLLDFTQGEPYELICGDKALGEGFSEGLSLVAEGGDAEFIIPSSLAFGSEGFEGVILPYTSFVLNVKVVDIMTAEEYEEEQNRIMEQEEKENEKRLQEEPKKIANYLKSHNINVEPTESGLYYIETQAGDGDVANVGDNVSINYSIYNLDDVLIESSEDYGQTLDFVVGNKDMLPAIEEAVGYMKVGGKSRIVVPSKLGFGNIKIDDNLPANTAIVIDLELVDLQ